MSPLQNWENWNENDFRNQLKECGLEASAIDRLIADDWNSGDVLSDVTLDDLTRAKFTPGQIARFERLLVKFEIPNFDLNNGGTAATATPNPSSKLLQDSLRSVASTAAEAYLREKQ
jgi:hypothetical protein